MGKKKKSLRPVLVTLGVGLAIVGGILVSKTSDNGENGTPTKIVTESKKGIIRARQFFSYKDQRTDIGYMFHENDLLSPDMSHPIYGTASGSITNNSKMQVVLEIPKIGDIEKIIINGENCLNKGVFTSELVEPEKMCEFSSPGREDTGLIYWTGNLDLESGDNFFRPMIVTKEGRWMSVGTDWRYITCFTDEKQARQYAQTPRRPFNGYRGPDPGQMREKAETEMTLRLNEIIDVAVKDGRLK